MLSQTALVSILATLSAVSALCLMESGNYYCSNTNAVEFSNVGYSGSYKDVTNMDETSCLCTQLLVLFSGSNTPLDEELSVHFRGPLKLLNFAVYYPGSSSNSKRDAIPEPKAAPKNVAAHGHAKRALTTVEVVQTVYVDLKGNPISGAITDVGVIANTKVATTQAASVASTLSTSTVSTAGTTGSTGAAAVSSKSSSSSAAAASSAAAVSLGDWVRSSYYTPGSTSNVTFLNTLGGTGSGVWLSCFGNSLLYASADGTTGASSAQALEEVTLGSDSEYIIMSGSSCTDSSAEGDCGYYRLGIPAYHGFGGASKLFAFEFQMPTASGSSGTNNYDMPAIWLLNAKIPRTLQYGDSLCLCWLTGCGELDLFEVLNAGNDKLICHLHDGQGNDGSSTGGGGSQDYFTRPTTGSAYGVAYFNGDDSSIRVMLVDSFDFGSTLSADTISGYASQLASAATLS